VIVTNNLLFETARCIDNGRPESDDSDLIIPNNMSATIELRSVCDEPTIFDVNNPSRNSIHLNTFILVNGGGGAVTTQLATIAKGYWEFDLVGSFTSNYQDVAGSFEHRIELRYGGIVMPMIGFKAGGAAAAPVAQTMSRRLRLLIPKTATIFRVGNNNGVGELANSTYSMWIQRLL